MLSIKKDETTLDLLTLDSAWVVYDNYENETDLFQLQMNQNFLLNKKSTTISTFLHGSFTIGHITRKSPNYPHSHDQKNCCDDKILSVRQSH
jgi:hypothetical protein